MTKRRARQTAEKANDVAFEDSSEWSKSKKKRMRSLRAKMAKQHNDSTAEQISSVTNQRVVHKRSDQALPETTNSNLRGTSALQESFKARLTGSRFRTLNEELYTTTSSTAFQKFSKNPELYDQYHEGFRHQVEQWPVNPIKAIVKSLMSSTEKSNAPLVVADFGCGDAELAKHLLKVKVNGKCLFKVHSFDLVASCDLVTACDMANVPLASGTVDVGLFCLSLMGTNLADFIREAHRVIKSNGRLRIAEVRSRFESTNKKDELEDFLGVLDKLGFACIKKDRSNKMFVVLDLKKNGKTPIKDLTFTAKPCIYKRR